jgi:hypothetical protein
MKKKNVITAFAQGHTKLGEYDKLIARNLSIRNIVLPEFGSKSTDIVIFHDGSIAESHQKYIRTKSKTDLIFINVKETLPKTAFQKMLVRPNIIPDDKASNLLTKQLNHFWFIDFLDYLNSYDYMLHIGESLIIESIGQVFQQMQEQGLYFLSPANSYQNPDQTVALADFCRFFEASWLEQSKDFSPLQTPTLDLVVLDLDFFRKNQRFWIFQQSIKAIGMIYTHSWSAKSLWSCFLSLYCQPNQYSFNDKSVSYYNQESGIITNPLPSWQSSLFNVAKNKPASTNAEYWPPLDYIESSVDNVVSGTPTGAYTFNTVPTENPYWQVDLGKPYKIEAIEIHNRDVAEFRALGMVFEASLDCMSFEKIHEQNDLFFGSKRFPLVIDYRKTGKEVMFRYLRLRIPRTEQLCLDQVMIYIQEPKTSSKKIDQSTAAAEPDTTQVKDQNPEKSVPSEPPSESPAPQAPKI